MDINSLNGVAGISAGTSAGTPAGSSGAGPVESSGTTSDVATSQANGSASAPKAASPPPSLEQVQQAVKNLNASLSQNGQGVQFAIDQSSKRVVVKVLDEKTHQVLRQIPSEELLELSMALDQKLGKLIHQQA